MSRLDVLFVIPTNVLDFSEGRVKDAREPSAKARFMAAYLLRRGCSAAMKRALAGGSLASRL